MAKNELSQKMMDAYMIGDIEEANRIQAQILKEHEERVANSFPKKSKKVNSVIKVNTVLNDDKAPATAVYDFLNKELGKDWWELEIETIHHLLWTKFGIVLSDVNNDKVLAIRHLCNTNMPFYDWYEFNQIALAFGGAIADFTHLRTPSPGMCVNAVKAMMYIRPDQGKEFDPEVQKYIAVVLYENGVYTPPPTISWLIADEMKEIVSEDTRKKWSKINKEFKRLLQGGTPGENEVGIQAKRLVLAEAAGITL